MKQLIIILSFVTFGSGVQAQPGLEMHYSLNRPLASSRAYYGGGIGANVLFLDAAVFNIKTGLEVNYFHTWDDGIFSSKMSTSRDLHYRYAVVSIPACIRLSFGNRVKFFLEGGAYIGFGGGKVRYTYTSYGINPGQYSVTNQTKDYIPGLFISPSVAFGVRFPVAERLDLFIKPEFTFAKNFRLSGDKTGAGYGGDYDFNYRYTYLRLCVGLHLKPRMR